MQAAAAIVGVVDPRLLTQTTVGSLSERMTRRLPPSPANENAGAAAPLPPLSAFFLRAEDARRRGSNRRKIGAAGREMLHAAHRKGKPRVSARV